MMFRKTKEKIDEYEKTVSILKEQNGALYADKEWLTKEVKRLRFELKSMTSDCIQGEQCKDCFYCGKVSVPTDIKPIMRCGMTIYTSYNEYEYYCKKKLYDSCPDFKRAETN